MTLLFSFVWQHHKQQCAGDNRGALGPSPAATAGHIGGAAGSIKAYTSPPILWSENFDSLFAYPNIK